MYGVNPYTYSGAQAVPLAGFPGLSPQVAGQLMPQPDPTAKAQPMVGGPVFVAAPRAEETYVENILRMNRGKVATVYTTNENNPQWAAKVFKGRVENAARDHVVLSDVETGMRYIILMINIDYITFDEPLNFDPSFYAR